MEALNNTQEHRCLKLLGLSGNASTEDIKRAFRMLAKKMHPDANPAGGNPSKFAEIRNAYDYLTRNRNQTITFPRERSTAGRSYRPNKKEPGIFSWGEDLLTSAVPSVRIFAARALGNSGKRAAYTFLRKALYDTDELVVQEAVKSIGQLEITQSAGELASLYNRSDREMKLHILSSVEKMGHLKNFQNLILTGIKDINPDVRRKFMKLFFRYRSETGETRN